MGSDLTAAACEGGQPWPNPSSYGLMPYPGGPMSGGAHRRLARLAAEHVRLPAAPEPACGAALGRPFAFTPSCPGSWT